MRSRSLNCSVATLTRERPMNSRSLIKVTQITYDHPRAPNSIREECKHPISFLQSTARAFIQAGFYGIWVSGAQVDIQLRFPYIQLILRCVRA